MGLRITTLIENNPDDFNKLCFEHGLSLLIEADGSRILFDTGQSGAFIKNAELINQDLTNLDYTIISHGHYDHSGGFIRFIDTEKKSQNLIVGEEFFESKYKKISENEYKYIGNSFKEVDLEVKKIPITKVKEDLYYLSKNIMIFKNFVRSSDYEKRSDKFFVGVESNSFLQHKSVYERDEFPDEIALGINTDKGLVVIVGCSHIGIINILSTIVDRIALPIYAVIGGTHLVDADVFRIQQTISWFKAMNINYIIVSHCTGEQGIKAINESLGEKFIFNNTGNVINL